MSSEINKAAEKLAKLQAQAEKYSGPLAEAQAALETARKAEAERQAERRKQYSRDYLKTYRERADAVVEEGNAEYEKFKELISAEPWFVAFAKYRAARDKRRHILDSAQRAQNVLGEVITVPESRWYESTLINDLVSLADKLAGEFGGEFDRALTVEYDDFVKGAD
jgi:chromosome segregation ATPase